MIRRDSELVLRPGMGPVYRSALPAPVAINHLPRRCVKPEQAAVVEIEAPAPAICQTFTQSDFSLAD